MTYLSVPSPVGDLTLFEEDGGLVALDWGSVQGGSETPFLCRVRDQLAEYFAGSRRTFELALAARGSPFQKAVWSALLSIPYGEIVRYGDLATRLGSAPRAVGGACGRNPLPIIVPCHRVVAANGSLGGYSGLDGLDTKRFLLGLEGWTGA
jgi:methylated-DNA-[protein]-cysteine S-methyltransferase